MEKIIKSGQSFLDFKKKATTDEFPQAFTDYIKSFGEVYFWEKGKFHVITKAQDAKEILTSNAISADRGQFFISRMPNLDLSLIQDFFSVVKKMMVMSDGADHADKRKMASKGFEDHILESFNGKIEETIRSFVAEIKSVDEFDFVEKIAKKLPSVVLADLFSIPEKDRELFFKYSNIMTGFFGGASDYQNKDGIEVNEAASFLKNYFKNLIKDRTNNPGQDYVSISLKSLMNFNLTEDEVVSQFIMMLVAGMATTTDQLSNIMYLLATHPHIQKEISQDKKLIPKMIEEAKRLDPAVTFIFRVAKERLVIRNQLIEAGDVIFISTHAINRDLESALLPDSFDIHRKQMHYSYGYGAHYCIGAKLARMEMEQVFNALIEHFPKLTINQEKESVRDHYSLSFSGFKSLHVKKA